VPKFVDHPILGRRFDDALFYVNCRHRYQVRKGGLDQPYVSHLLGVCAIVLDNGGNETQAIGALLHDIVEDLDVTLEEIDLRFGAEVAEIVRECTDSIDGKHSKGNWTERKQTYVAKLAKGENADALIVSAADKLFNCRSIVRDIREFGEEFWTRFNSDRGQTLWYYTEGLAGAFEKARLLHPDNRVLGRILDEYKAAVADLPER
jgi:(p)ppGpp synthase/HD superfamily hydrolase